MLDLTGLSKEMFRHARKGINMRVVPVGKKTITVNGRTRTVTVYSTGIAEDGRLGRIPTGPAESEESENE